MQENPIKLFVDIGNSRLKWMWIDSQRCSEQEALDYQTGALDQLLDEHWGQLGVPDAVWIGNVAGPQLERQLQSWIDQRWGVMTHFARSEAAAGGVRNAYAEPNTLGVDRWLGLLGAHHYRNQQDIPYCVVDCGTAVTLDILAADGEHLGGLILPGVNTMRSALQYNTHALQVLDVPSTQLREQILAKDTQMAMSLGACYALSATIQRLMEDFSLPPSAGVITGGDAELLMPWLDVQLTHVPDLVLRGLVVLAEGA